MQAFRQIETAELQSSLTSTLARAYVFAFFVIPSEVEESQF